MTGGKLSEFNSGKTSIRGGCGKTAAIGCGAILALYLFVSLMSMLTFGSVLSVDSGNVIAAVLGIALVVFFIIRSRKQDKQSSANMMPGDSTVNPYAPKPKQLEQNLSPSAASSSSTFENPVCTHIFSREQIYSANYVTCECGNLFRTADLVELNRLQENLSFTQSRLNVLRKEIRKTAKTAASDAPARGAASTSSASSSVSSAVAKPKPVRPKLNLSLQQWLIIGASVLVLVAGSVFVSTNINRLDQWVFQLITVALAAATGFGAFKARGISVLLSNFLAAFSSSMQLATLSIIGDQISPDFEWNTMPAWWWFISLVVVSSVAALLAKLSKNYGFKGIAILSGAGSLMVLSLGVLRPEIAATFAPVYLAFAGIAGAGVLALNRFIRAIKAEIPKEKEAAAYAKDLARREDTSLRVLGQILVGLILLTSVGLAMAEIDFGALTYFNWISLVATGLTWALLAQYSKFWIDQVEFGQLEAALILTVARGVSFVSLALAATFGALELDNRVTGAIVSVLLLALLTWLAPSAKSFSPNRVSVVVALWSSLSAWIIWSRIDLFSSENAWITGAYAIAFASVLSISDLRFKVNRFDLGSVFVSGVGVIVITWCIARSFELDFKSFNVAALSLTLVIATAIQLPLRHFVNKRQKFDSAPLTKWVAFSFGTLVSVLLLLQSTSNGQIDEGTPIAFAIAFILLAIAAQALAIWTPIAKNFGAYLAANHYLAQAVVLISVLISISATGSRFASTNALLIATLAVLNYALGTFKRQEIKMQLGFAAALSAFLVWQWSLGDQDFTAALSMQIAVFSAATWLHTWFLRKRTDSKNLTLTLTPVIATLSVSIAGWLVLLQVTAKFGWNELVFANASYAVLSLAAVAMAKFSSLGKLRSRALGLNLVSAEFALFALLSNLIHVAAEPTHGRELRLLITLLAISVGLWIKNFKLNSVAIVPWFYLSNISAALIAGILTEDILNATQYPEARSVWLAAALVISTVATKAEIGKLRRTLLIDVPVLATALWSLVFAIVGGGTNLDVNTWRGILSLAVIAAFAYWRTSCSNVLSWLFTGYVAGLGSAIWLASGLQRWFGFNFDGPEFYSVLGTASLVIGNFFLVKRLGKKFTELRLILTVGGLTLPSLTYALTFDSRSLENEIRAFLALAVISALALWRISRSRPQPWVIAAYISSVAASLAAARLISDQLLRQFEGPELYAILASATIFGVHRLGLKHLPFKSSLFEWGLPFAVLLLPSTFYTYTSLEIPFSELDVAQLVRIVVVLLLSAALFIHGSRFGNLATSAVGLATLALLVVPNTALHSEDVVAGSQVDSTSLVIALLAFAIISLIRRYTSLAANSLLFIGVPIGIALAPALTQSLIALGNPTLTSVDWWRFGMILSAGMILLLVGTLREVAGLFYPGLISVLLSALPYGFRQTQQNQWSLWVLLLLVAAVMVWLAVRLEKIKKAGRNSATWLKELK